MEEGERRGSTIIEERELRDGEGKQNEQGDRMEKRIRKRRRKTSGREGEVE